MGKTTRSIPKYGLKVKLNHVYPEHRTQDFRPSFKQLWVLVPLIFRYVWYYFSGKIRGKSIVMDYIRTAKSQQIYGVPLGGIGCGTIGRGYRGEFCRFQMKPGLYETTTVDADQFIVTVKNSKTGSVFQSVLSTFPKKALQTWENLLDPSACSYTGLYPRAWTEYDLSKYGILLTCRQVSPVIPHNYKDSSLPAAVFVWDVKNISEEPRTVTLAFTFKNGVGNPSEDRNSICSTKPFTYEQCEGVILHQTIKKMHCSYLLSAKTTPASEVSKCLYFDPNSDGKQLWEELKSKGGFTSLKEKNHGQVFGEMGCAIAVKQEVPARSNCEVEMSLVWHMPSVNFPENNQRKLQRYYTKYFGVESAALKIVQYCFENYSHWEDAIEKWQSEVLDDSDLPDWYKGALFNESYFISDGGTIWVTLSDEEMKNLPQNDPRRQFGKFAWLEGQEYRMYNTYDVHFYASFALITNFPKLQYSLQYGIRDAIFAEISEKVRMLYDGDVVERKKRNTVPHDIGDPGEEPFAMLNAYPIHDVSAWRDLNVKFVLQVFRDASFLNLDSSESAQYIKDMYKACRIVMYKTLSFDEDNDGLIENSGTPDQTFDTWTMTGSSAYCGGLWLAALFAMTKVAALLGEEDDVKTFQEILDKGKAAFERKLWNGTCYNFDCSANECKSIMADQLCGQWYLKSCGYNYEVFPKDHVSTSLQTIYQNNVLKFCNGTMGAVNGFINGSVDKYTIQSEEVWTGVTYALAASMLQEGMLEEGFKTAGGMYESMVYKFGLAFDTPEALYEKKFVRALAYMRPLSIWSMQRALEQRRQKTQG